MRGDGASSSRPRREMVLLLNSIYGAGSSATVNVMISWSTSFKPNREPPAWMVVIFSSDTAGFFSIEHEMGNYVKSISICLPNPK